MTPYRLGLASKTHSVSTADLARVASAIGVQITRDFQPLWGIQAAIAVLPDSNAIPPGVWPVFVVDDGSTNGEAGLHLNAASQPYALVMAGDSWSLAASHECLEMLVDPGGNKLITSTGIEVVAGTIRDLPGVKLNYLVEVADPSEDQDNAYLVDDVLLSDFYTHHFFDPVAAPGVRYSFTGRITAPRQILRNGYISWMVPGATTMRQLQNFTAPEAGGPIIVDLPGDPTTSSRSSLRGFVDSHTKAPVTLSRADRARAAGGYADARTEWMRHAAAAHAKMYAWAVSPRETLGEPPVEGEAGA